MARGRGGAHRLKSYNESSRMSFVQAEPPLTSLH